MESPDKYIEQQYHFKGKWDVPSVCGLKIIENQDNTIVIATNLYKINPGTSISRWSAQLATTICHNFDIEFDHLIFIERNPDSKSKLDFYKETFDIVKFSLDTDQLTNPVWKRVSKEAVDEMMR